MSHEFWDQRYAENETVYGNKPNAFFREFIDTHQPGSILLPAEGEGRNAVYAAQKGWNVDAFDFSSVAVAKAGRNAAAAGVHINYMLLPVEAYTATKQYNAIGLFFVHLPKETRSAFHQKMAASLQPGGYLVAEFFSKEQLRYDSGGPRDINLLYDISTLRKDFRMLHILHCGEHQVTLDEGPFHQGKAAVIRLLAQKI